MLNFLITIVSLLYAVEDLPKVFVAGHNGMVGSAIVRRLQNENVQILTASRDELDLTRQESVEKWFVQNKPNYVYLSAAKVGGMKANIDFPADFIYQNLMIETNVIHSSYKYNAKKLLLIASAAIYPNNANQPIKEEDLLSGNLDETKGAYAIAKIAGIKMCESYKKQYGCNFISVVPNNIYGPGDQFDTENGHVIACLINKFHSSKDIVDVWGTGNPMREFIYVDDFADACVFLMKNYSNIEPINVGIGKDIAIKDLANLIAKEIGYNGSFVFNKDMPDGTPRRLLAISKLQSLGWTPKISLDDGIKKTYQWFLENQDKIRK